jgi:hypothetical protein
MNYRMFLGILLVLWSVPHVIFAGLPAAVLVGVSVQSYW